MAATILYLDTIPGERIQEMTLAGIRRYAAARGWDAAAVPVEESRPTSIPALLAAHSPVAGCVVECSDGRRDLPPRLFGKVPVVYLHAAPSLYGGRGLRVNADNAAIATAAFRELSVGRPDAFAAVAFAGYTGRREWSTERERAFADLAARSGRPFFHFPWRRETEERRRKRLAAWISALPGHTAVFAVNDLTAAEVAVAARAARRSIPRELILLGVDNAVAMCESSPPALSSIQIDHERSGYLAAKMLGDQMGVVRKFPIDNCSGIANVKTDLKFGTCGHLSQLSIAHNLVSPLLTVRRESTRGSGRREPFVMEAVGIIRREACGGLTAQALASRFRCSRWLFEMRFREAMGHSVLDEITSVRMEQASTLLSATDTPVGIVADMCGFGSYRSLHAVFRAKTGMSPTAFREQSRK